MKINTIEEFKQEFNKLGNNYKTKDIDRFNKELIKYNINVSFLKDIIMKEQQYHRTYFQVSLAQRKTIEDKLLFIEDNFNYLDDWWHVDQLTQFVNNNLDFDYIYEKAKLYIQDDREFVRRWGYVIFMPTLVKNDKAYKLFELFKNNDKYYDIMAQAWLISYLAIYLPNETIELIKSKKLEYNIIGKAIQKICDSFRISADYKTKVKELREIYK